MSFVSSSFFLLMAILFPVYYLLFRLKPQVQWLVLLAVSYVFYAYSSPEFIAFLLASTFITWFFPLLLQRENTHLDAILFGQGQLSQETKKQLKRKTAQRKKLLMAACLVCNLGILFFMKYGGFLNRIIGGKFSFHTALPLGISFYTFQSLGYCIDVYRELVPPEKNFLKYALFVSFFPQISQGPIGKYEELAPQLFVPHGFERQKIRRGTERFLLGLFKKLVVANNLGFFVDSAYISIQDRSGIVLALATILYAFQLYADFSGYMDMACGVSLCLGIRLRENFETPYFSYSISEFWRRWHISLGAWFRDYLYYPLLRSPLLSRLGKTLRKRGKKKLAQKLPVSFALFVTWFLIGLWHGADYTFICYGLYHGMFVILDTLLSDLYEKMRQRLSVNTTSCFWTSFRIVRTFCITCFGYILFRADGMQSVRRVIDRIFRFFYYEGWSKGFYSEQFDMFYWCSMAILLLVFFGLEFIGRKENVLSWLDRQTIPVRWSVLYFLIGSVLCVVLFSDVHEASAGNFLYFNF